MDSFLNNNFTTSIQVTHKLSLIDITIDSLVVYMYTNNISYPITEREIRINLGIPRMTLPTLYTSTSHIVSINNN